MIVTIANCYPMFLKRLKMALLSCLLLIPIPQTAIASCLNPSTDSRLQTYCLVNSSKKQRIDLQTAQIVDYRLKQEGYERGLGLPGAVKQTSFSPYATPIVDYSSDINGGNPNRALVLGNLTFTGDETLLRKEGLVAGFGVGANGRHIYGEGRYLDYGLGVSYAHSPEHDIGIGRAFTNLHSKNHIRNHWYVDAYASTSKLQRDLADDISSTVGVDLVKLFASEQHSYHQATVGVRRFYDEDYKQNQLTFGLKNIHSNGLYTAVNVTVGEAVKNTLATRHSLSTTVGTSLFNKPISATYAYSFADGGKLLGIEREDTSQSLTISYAVHPRVNITIGYRDTDSSIGYFSESEPIVGVQFAPIRF